MKRHWIRFKGLYTQNLIVSIPVTGIVLFTISFFLFYGKYDLFIFPFYAEVWGVASDWMIFMVTSITAFYIWKTLKAQQDVQSIQQFATLLQYNSYEQAFAPKFETQSNMHPVYRPESNQIRLDFEFLITNTGYTAKALTLVSDSLRIYPDYPRKEIPKDTTVLIFISGAIPIESSNNYIQSFTLKCTDNRLRIPYSQKATLKFKIYDSESKPHAKEISLEFDDPEPDIDILKFNSKAVNGKSMAKAKD